MAELIGTAAAALQLAACCTSLCQVLDAVRHASSAIPRYKDQLEILKSICCSIQDNSFLRTKEIETQVRSMISSITNYIDGKLGKSRFLRRVRYIFKRAEFVEFFRILEEKKSSLVLSISNLSASTIDDISCDVKIIRSWTALESSEKVEVPKSKSPRDSINQPNPSMPSSNYQIDGCQHPEQNSTPIAEMAQITGKGIYRGQTHRGNGTQLNAPNVNGKPNESLKKLMENLKWLDNIKEAAEERKGNRAPKDAQLNGPKFANAEWAEPYAGYWEGNIMKADGLQVNGPTYG